MTGENTEDLRSPELSARIGHIGANGTALAVIRRAWRRLRFGSIVTDIVTSNSGFVSVKNYTPRPPTSRSKNAMQAHVPSVLDAAFVDGVNTDSLRFAAILRLCSGNGKESRKGQNNFRIYNDHLAWKYGINTVGLCV